MKLHHTLALTAGLFAASISAAVAQVVQQGEPPCLNEIMPLRAEAEKRGAAVQAAAERKAPQKEICALIRRFEEAESKYIKYAENNATWCGIPAEALKQMSAAHSQTVKVRTQVCTVAVAPQPRGPTLGEVLGTTTVPEARQTKSGRGVFDTLTGNALTR